MDEKHPVIIAMCDAAYGKAQNHKLKRRKEMLRAFEAAQDFYSMDKVELRHAVSRLGDAFLRVGQRGAVQ